jgi:hypothetical protein
MAYEVTLTPAFSQIILTPAFSGVSLWVKAGHVFDWETHKIIPLT